MDNKYKASNHNINLMSIINIIEHPHLELSIVIYDNGMPNKNDLVLFWLSLGNNAVRTPNTYTKIFWLHDTPIYLNVYSKSKFDTGEFYDSAIYLTDGLLNDHHDFFKFQEQSLHKYCAIIYYNDNDATISDTMSYLDETGRYKMSLRSDSQKIKTFNDIISKTFEIKYPDVIVTKNETVNFQHSPKRNLPYLEDTYVRQRQVAERCIMM